MQIREIVVDLVAYCMSLIGRSLFGDPEFLRGGAKN